MARTKKESISPIKVAEEINKVFGYGTDPDGDPTVIVDESELIDITQPEAELIENIKERCEQDLNIRDEDAFTPETWKWFADNEIEPNEDLPDGIDEDEEESEDEEKPATKPATKPVTKVEKPVKDKTNAKEKAEKPVKEAKEKKGGGFGRGRGKPSMEKVVFDAVGANNKIDVAGVVKVITPVYAELGKTDADYILARAKIYLNIALIAHGLKEKMTRSDAMKKAIATKKENTTEKKEEAAPVTSSETKKKVKK